MNKILLIILMFVLLVHTSLAAEGDLKWSYTTAGNMQNNYPVISKEGFVCVTPDTTSTIYCVNPDGTLFDSTVLGAFTKLQNPSIDEDTSNVFTFDDAGVLRASRIDGTLIWSETIGQGYGIGVTIGSNGIIYAIDSWANVYARYANNGTILWNLTYDVDSGTVYMPASISKDNSMVYFSHYNGGGSVDAIYANNGTRKWRYDDDGDNETFSGVLNTPAISDDGTTIYVTISGHKIYNAAGLVAINASDGSESWFSIADNITSYQTHSGPTISKYNDVVYYTNAPNFTYAVYVNGTEKWNSSLPINEVDDLGVYTPNMIELTDGDLITVYMGDLYKIDQNTGNGTLLYYTGVLPNVYAGGYGSASIASDGTIYFGVNNGILYAIEGVSGTKSAYNLTDYNDANVANNLYVARNQPLNPCSKTNINSRFYSNSPAIDHNGNVVFTDYNYPTHGRIWSFDQNLTERWNYTIGGSSTSSMIGTDDVYYVYEETNNKVWAFYPNGTLKWSYADIDADFDAVGSMLFDDNGYLYLKDSSSYTYSFYSEGSLRYKINTGYSWTDISIDLSNNIYSSSYSPLKKLLSLSQNGKYRWNSSTFSNTLYASTLSNDGNLLFTHVGSLTNSTVTAVYANNGTVIWNYSTGDRVRSNFPFLEYNDIIYFKSYNYIHSVYSNNGTLKWKYQDNSNNADSGVVLSKDGKLYYIDGLGIIHSLNLDGTLNWKYQTEDILAYSTPAISTNGYLYTTSRSELYSCNIGSPAMYTLDDYLNNTISNTFILSRHQYSNITALVQNIVISFSGESVNPTLVTPTETSTISINITTTGVSISTAIVKIAGTNYTMTNTAGNTWQYLFTGHPVGTYDIDNYYAQDHSSKWGSTTSSLSIEVYDDGGGGGPTPTPTVLPTPRPTDQPGDGDWWSGFNDSINQLKITISPLWQSILFMLLSLIIIGYMTKDE